VKRLALLCSTLMVASAATSALAQGAGSLEQLHQGSRAGNITQVPEPARPQGGVAISPATTAPAGREAARVEQPPRVDRCAISPQPQGCEGIELPGLMAPTSDKPDADLNSLSRNPEKSLAPAALGSEESQMILMP